MQATSLIPQVSSSWRLHVWHKTVKIMLALVTHSWTWQITCLADDRTIHVHFNTLSSCLFSGYFKVNLHTLWHGSPDVTNRWIFTCCTCNSSVVKEAQHNAFKTIFILALNFTVSSGTSVSYLEAVPFKFWSFYRLSCLRFFLVFFSTSSQTYDHYLLSLFEITSSYDIIQISSLMKWSHLLRPSRR